MYSQVSWKVVDQEKQAVLAHSRCRNYVNTLLINTQWTTTYQEMFSES